MNKIKINETIIKYNRTLPNPHILQLTNYDIEPLKENLQKISYRVRSTKQICDSLKKYIKEKIFDKEINYKILIDIEEIEENSDILQIEATHAEKEILSLITSSIVSNYKEQSFYQKARDESDLIKRAVEHDESIELEE